MPKLPYFVFSSQQDLISHLEQSLKAQTNTVQQLLQNVQNIAKGEQKLTEALSWAQGRIAEAQTRLTEVINISADMTDSEKCKKLIAGGQFQQTAQAMQQAAKEAYGIMNDLNFGLTTRILDTQEATAASRDRTEAQLREFTSQQRETNDALKQANDQIQQKKQEIARLNTEHQSALARIEKTNADQIQNLTAEIEREKQSLAGLTEDKGTLPGNLKNVEAQLVSLQEKVRSLEATNTELRAQCDSQKQTMEAQQAMIDEQKHSLKTVQDAPNRLQTQTQGRSWTQTAAPVVGAAIGMIAVKAIGG
jgi:chromosome segregation ATPase